MNVFEIFYNSGLTLNHCLLYGPVTLERTLLDCSTDEIQTLAKKQLAFTTGEIKTMDRSELIGAIISKVVMITSRDREMGDY